MKISDLSNSKYMKKEDVGRVGITLTIRNIYMDDVGMPGEQEEKPIIEWTDTRYKPMVLNRTNTSILAAIYPADDTAEWHGKPIHVYEDPTVGFAGKITGGLRLKQAVDFDDDIPM